jgi:hypothetical protein
VTVRADQVALRELLLEQTGAAAPRQRREIIHFGGAWAMIEGHSDGMKASPAIDTGLEFEFAHPRDETLPMFATLNPTNVSGTGVVDRVV